MIDYSDLRPSPQPTEADERMFTAMRELAKKFDIQMIRSDKLAPIADVPLFIPLEMTEADVERRLTMTILKQRTVNPRDAVFKFDPRSKITLTDE